MKTREFSRGEGRTQVLLSAYYLGNDIVVHIYNKNAHIGAVAIAEYDTESARTSTSVITRRGHKDNIVASETAYKITKTTKKPCCVIAGIHLDNITGKEIEDILVNVKLVSDDFLKREI
jgi:cobalamin biosynthesis Co2+ chelatase CbiK